MSALFPAGWMILQGSVSIAYWTGVAIMSPLGLEDNVVDTVSIIPNTMQSCKHIWKHFKPKPVSVMLPASQIPALLFGI